MYLSRLWINPRDRSVQCDLADLQAQHRTIMSAFPEQDGPGLSPRANMSVLYRQEEDPRTHAPFLLVQSRLPPDWDRLPPRYLLESPAGEPEPVRKSLLPFLEALHDGATFRFRLRANPTKKAATRDEVSGLHARSKRVDLRQEEDQRQWLTRKGQQHGFLAQALRVQDEPRITGRRRSGQGNVPTVVVAPVLYQGMLQVTNARALRQAVEEGIGPARAYGCGLLSLAPASV